LARRFTFKKWQHEKKLPFLLFVGIARLNFFTKPQKCLFHLKERIGKRTGLKYRFLFNLNLKGNAVTSPLALLFKAANQSKVLEK